MNISLQDPNNRLLIFLAAFIVVLGLLALDRLSNPPAGSGILTIGLWLLLFGIAGAILYDVLHYERRPTTRFSHYGGPDPGQTGSGNPWVQKANRALMIFCLSLAYEILVLMVLPVLIPYFTVSGSIDLPGVLGIVGIVIIIGIPAFFIVMFWSENTFVDAVRWLDPDLASGWQIPHGWSGLPFFLPALLIVLYAVFLGWFFSDLVSPVIIPYLPAPVSRFFNPLLASVTLALFATPAIIYLIFRRRD
jgi:hypothetical protein